MSYSWIQEMQSSANMGLYMGYYIEVLTIFNLKIGLEKIIRNSSIIWISLIFYLAAIELIVLIKEPKLFLSGSLFLNRIVLLAIFIFHYFLKSKLSTKVWSLFTIISIYASLTLLYKETAVLNQLFYPSIDAMLMQWDEWIFGMQTALEFSKAFPSRFVSELLFMGYFSYYLMPLAILFLLFKKAPEKLEEFGFILITSFLIYYLIFILFPAVGPQFYWSEPQSLIESQGIFGDIVKKIQENGEVPTAAFPSSHIGIASILLLWLYTNLKKYWKYFIPFMFLLILATVYIKAHYVVDGIAGLLSAPLVYYTSKQLFHLISKYYVDNH